MFPSPRKKPYIDLGKVSIASLPISGPVNALSAPTPGGGVCVLGILGTLGSLGTLTHGIRNLDYGVNDSEIYIPTHMLNPLSVVSLPCFTHSPCVYLLRTLEDKTHITNFTAQST